MGHAEHCGGGSSRERAPGRHGAWHARGSGPLGRAGRVSGRGHRAAWRRGAAPGMSRGAASLAPRTAVHRPRPAACRSGAKAAHRALNSAVQAPSGPRAGACGGAVAASSATAGVAVDRDRGAVPERRARPWDGVPRARSQPAARGGSSGRPGRRRCARMSPRRCGPSYTLRGAPEAQNARCSGPERAARARWACYAAEHAPRAPSSLGAAAGGGTSCTCFRRPPAHDDVITSGWGPAKTGGGEPHPQRSSSAARYNKKVLLLHNTLS